MTEAPDASAGTAKDASSQRRILACLLLGLFALSAYDAVFPVFATRIRAYFSINAEQYGTLMGMASIGRIPALLLVGPLIAGVGVRRIAKIALAGIGVSFLIIGIGGKLNALYAGIVVMGLFMALGGVAIPALLIALFPDLKRRIFSIHLVAAAVPGILIPLLAHQMLVWSADKGDRAFAVIFFCAVHHRRSDSDRRRCSVGYAQTGPGVGRTRLSQCGEQAMGIAQPSPCDDRAPAGNS